LVVRVKLRIKSKFTNRSIELVVLANGGAESPKAMRGGRCRNG